MYDLTIVQAGGEVAAIEVTTAADARSVGFWRAADSGEPWTDPRIHGAWAVRTTPQASVKALRRRLPDLLVEFQASGVTVYDAPDEWELHPPHPEAAALGVTSAFHGPSDHEGRIYLMPPADEPPAGSFVSGSADRLVDWAVAWLRLPEHSDNLAKLAAARAPERHLFLILPSLTVAPDEVAMALLCSEMPSLPDRPPDLPDPLTHLWLASAWSVPYGIRWHPDQGWLLFPAGDVA
jgi:hypothetical protein